MPLVVCVAPVSAIFVFGENPSLSQSVAANGTVGDAVSEAIEVSVAPIVSGAHEVGLRIVSGRSIVTLALRSSSGTPSRIVGSGSLSTRTWASLRSSWIEARTTTSPRSKGPATAGTTIESP